MPDTSQTDRFLMIGGGIAALAAAFHLIRDAGVPGHAIRILDDQPHPGGSLDGSGEATWGYLTRGGRMFEPNFVNTLGLFADIPVSEGSSVSVKDDILAFNTEVNAGSHCRLLVNGRKADMDDLQLTANDILALNRLMLTPETRLSDRTIASWFDRSFFDGTFWIMWSTMFSFQPWHSLMEMRRYMKRFIHLLPGLTRIKGILRTRHDQYDSLIAPLVGWLSGHGVQFDQGVKVSGLDIEGPPDHRRVRRVHLENAGEITLGADDNVLITLGSMTDGASYGTNVTAAPRPGPPSPSWSLWRDLAQSQPGFGRPDAFCAAPDKTGWTSFTVTMDDDGFARHIEKLTGNVTGTGGLVTIRDSAWLMSFVMFAQPHFAGQPEGSTVFWGYGLRPDRTGDYLEKPMTEATGDDIITELCGQVHLSDAQARLFDGARVVPCHMPYITSQFMPRRAGDRPETRPRGAENFVLMGQFVEQWRDTVFTVEYSVRSARAAVHALTGCAAPLPVVRSDRNPRVLMRAANVLMGL